MLFRSKKCPICCRSMSVSQVYKVSFTSLKKTFGKSATNSEDETNSVKLASLSFDLEETKKKNRALLEEIE
jgi:dephospho-CoA kinase